jgi:hypothetical protein
MRMKSILAVSMSLVLVGCGQQFRYPCQDPTNWDNAECKRPICEVNRDCPDLIFKENPNIKLPAALPPPSPVPPSKGECK